MMEKMKKFSKIELEERCNQKDIKQIENRENYCVRNDIKLERIERANSENREEYSTIKDSKNRVEQHEIRKTVKNDSKNRIEQHEGDMTVEKDSKNRIVQGKVKMEIRRIESKIDKIETKNENRGRKRIRSNDQNLENEDTKKRKEIKAKPNGKDDDQSEEIENREKIRRMKEESKIEQSEDKKYRIRIRSTKTKSGEIRTKNKNFLEKTTSEK